MAQGTVHYRVELHPGPQELDVTVSIRNVVHGADLRLHVPTWVPGAYALMRYGRVIHSVTARGSDGRSLDVIRDGWSGFLVKGAPASLDVNYRAHLGDNAWGELTGYLEHDHGVLLGTPMLRHPGHAGAVTVEYVLPAGWTMHVPDGGTRVEGNTYRFDDDLRMLDTPVPVGRYDTRTRTCEGVAFDFVFVNRAVGFDVEIEGWMDAAMRIVAKTHAMFGRFPFSRYSFVVSFSPDHHWGLEHRASTMIGLGPDALVDPVERTRSLRLVAHELFHAWNVCSLKPAEFMRMDLEHGSYTDLLWVAEGVTRYQEFLLCVRSANMAPAEMFSNIVNYWRHLAWMPAYRRVSPADSSRGTFLNHHRYPGMLNTAIDYYDAGMLVAFDLDAILVGEGRTDLSEVFGRFYAEHVQRGYTQQDFQSFLASVSPAAAAACATEVSTAGALTVEKRLYDLGFRLEHKDVHHLGITLVDNKGPKILQVLDDAPAGRAGLVAGDVLLSVDGHGFTLKGLTWAARQSSPVRLRVQRGHAFHEFTVTPTVRRDLSAMSWAGTEEQQGRLRRWLHRPDLVLAAGQALSLSHHDNFHGIQQLL